MKLRLLGLVELAVEHRSLNLGGARQRIVLAMLALNANRVVPVDQLIDAVWGESPPATARSQIQICISALRRLFDDAGHPDAIDTRRPGYLLRLATHQLDSLEFTALVATAREQIEAGRLAEAAETLRTALSLWRGPALAGIPSEPVQRSATLLEERRLAAVEERVHLDLALGRHQEVISELQELVTDHPLRERLHAFLMLALYRAGRQAEALEAGRRARRVLIEEIGLEPGQELQELERSILRRDPTLGGSEQPALPAAPPARGLPGERPSPVVSVLPRQLPASITDFVNRTEQLAEIKSLLGGGPEADRPRWGMPIVVISGMGGVGKTSLAIRAAHELSAHYPDGQLYADLGTGDDCRQHAGRLLARFLRALGIAGSAVPEEIEERGELYRSMLSDRRLLLVLDDVSTEEQVLPLLPGSPSCAVIITSRRRLSGLPGAHQIDVDVLDSQHSIEMLARIIGPDRMAGSRDAAVELAALCGGLPLALRITGARLASRPHWRLETLVRRLRNEARRLDEFAHHGLELRSNIGLAHRALDDRTQRLFRLISLLPAPDFPSWIGAALLDSSLVEAEEILENLIDAQLVDIVQYPQTGPRYRLHDLIRVYAAEKLAQHESERERRAALERVLGAWLALAEEAHRREYGGDYTILHGTAPRWRLPAEDVARILDDPVDWWEGERRALVAAVRQAADAGLDELCWDLALTSVTLFETKGHFDDWLECAQVARETTERAGNRVGLAAMRYSLGTLHMFQTRLVEAERCFASALEIFRAEGEEHGCALVLRNTAHIDGLRGETAAMLAKYAESLAIMRRVGDRIGEAHIMRSLAKVRMDEGDTQAAVTLLNDALAICRQTGCLRVEAQVMYRFAELYLATDQASPARHALHRVLRIVRASGDRIGETYALYGLGLLRHQEGRLDKAEMILRQTVEQARGLGEQLIEAKARYALGEIAMVTGSTPSGVGHLRAAGALFERLGSALWQARTLARLADVCAADGNRSGEQELVEQAVRLLSATDSPESTRLLAELRARLTDDAAPGTAQVPAGI